MCDQNATRDVTSMLSKSGLALQIKRDMIASRLSSCNPFYTFNLRSCFIFGMFSRCYVLLCSETV